MKNRSKRNQDIRCKFLNQILANPLDGFTGTTDFFVNVLDSKIWNIIHMDIVRNLNKLLSIKFRK